MCIKSAFVDKAAPVTWLADPANDEYGFDLSRAVAFGDNPIGRDHPEMTFRKKFGFFTPSHSVRKLRVFFYPGADVISGWPHRQRPTADGIQGDAVRVGRDVERRRRP